MDITAWKFALKFSRLLIFFSTIAARGLLVKEKIRDYTNDFKSRVIWKKEFCIFLWLPGNIFFWKFSNEFLSFSNSFIQQNGSLLEQGMCRHGLPLRACRGQWKCCQSNVSREIPEPTTSKSKSDTRHVLTSQRTRVFLLDCFRITFKKIDWRRR